VSILGQMSFCDPNHINDPQNGLYCVNTNLISQKTPKAPQITSLKSISPTSIEVKWINPQDYPGGVEIKVFNTSTPASKENNCPNDDDTDNPDRRHCWFIGASLSSNNIDPNINEPYTKMTSTPFSYTVTGLSSGTTYEVIVRGILKK